MLQSGSTFIFHYRKSLGDPDQKHVMYWMSTQSHDSNIDMFA